MSSVLEHETGAGTPVELYCALFPIYRWIVLLQPRIAKDERVFPEVGDFGVKFLPMSETINCDVYGVGYVSCRVAGSVHVKNTYGICEGFQRETQSFSDSLVDEGGVSSTVQQCGDDLELAGLGGDSNVHEEFPILVDSMGIDGFRDLVSDRGEQNLFLGFVDGMKHRVSAPAALQSSRRRRLCGTRPS